MDILLRSLDAEIARVPGFSPAVLDLSADPPTVRVLNRMLILAERSNAVRAKGRRKIRFK